MVEHQVLRSISRSKQQFLQHRALLENVTLEPEIKKLLNLISNYYNEYPSHEFISKDELLAFYDYNYPNSKTRNDFIITLDQIYSLDTSDSLAADYVSKLLRKDFGVQLINLLLPALEGDVDRNIVDLVREKCAIYENSIGVHLQNASHYVEDDLTTLLLQKETHGLQWPLQALKGDLGIISGNTLGHFFAIPDAGKTSFIHFLAAGLCPQLEEGEVFGWFNNEEGGAKVKLRSYSAFCNATEEQIKAEPQRAEQVYHERGGSRLKLYDKAIITTDEIERECIKNKVRFAVVDIGDKVLYRGRSKAGNGADALQGVYDNLREVVKRVNSHHKFDMLTTGQAGTTAENKKWLQQSDLYAGKTGKAGAFDYIIGMGWLSETPTRRYISFCKNKVGTQSQRHVIHFDPLRARFKD